ncbi:MAG: MBL fold metallo-hydrolase [Terriglobales bacterium]
MRIRLIRHATLIVEFHGRTFLVDPMLDEPGARPAIPLTPNSRRNPLVPLPIPAQEFLPEIEAVLVTHTHADHWDEAAAALLPKHLPLFGQPEDENKFRAAGFAEVRSRNATTWNQLEITRTGGMHGTGLIAKMLAPVSGFVLRAAGEPTLYIAGDTVWCPAVETALKTFQPQVIVLNAGEARFLEGAPITMTAEDVIRVCQAAPNARVIAVHMEAINHCLLSRADLAFQLEAARLTPQVVLPNDGEWIDVERS